MIYIAVACYANVMHFGWITLFLRNCWNGDLGRLKRFFSTRQISNRKSKIKNRHGCF
jgi:hypothetical protein